MPVYRESRVWGHSVSLSKSLAQPGAAVHCVGLLAWRGALEKGALLTGCGVSESTDRAGDCCTEQTLSDLYMLIPSILATTL